MIRRCWTHAAKRWLYLIHRWIGIVTCLLFLIWFVSGLVMVYVPFPALGRAERLAGLPAIDWSRVRIDAAGAEAVIGMGAPRSITLEMAGVEPVWRVLTSYDDEFAVSAISGALLPDVGAAQAVHIAQAFARTRAVAVERLERDQWTVPAGYNRYRPLLRVRLSGEAGRDLYVSSTTGAVVLDTTARERFWNWLGSVPHWIYPTILRQNGEAWRQVVMWVSGPCILVAITGIWIGLLRTRMGARRYGGGRMTPYRGWMLWHHVAGLAGGLTLTLWIFSGWLSVDPGHVFESPGIDPDAMSRYVGAESYPTIDLPALAKAAGPSARRIELFWATGRPWLSVEAERGTTTLDATSLRPRSLRHAELVKAARALVPGAAIASVERLTTPDLYWYEVAGLPRLPVLRVKFADAASTWVHLDPATGRMLGSTDARRRTYRWLYDLFHKWDLNLLTLNRPAWDLFLWIFSLVGLVTSVSGVWIGYRRLRPVKRLQPPRPA
jgi:hypothetical protein